MAYDIQGAVGTVRLEEADPPKGQKGMRVVAYLTKAPIPVAGYGGWSRVARPRKKALTEWVGRDSLSIECQILFDTLEDAEGLFTENQIRDLESMAGLDSGDPEPPLLELHSEPPPLMPHGYHRAAHVQWFVDTLTWDADSIVVNKDGNRVRAGGTLTVTQYVEDDRLGHLSPAKKARSDKGKGKGKGKGGKRKTYTVKPGDTLQKIAARKDVYNDAKQWGKIAKANSIRDPKHLTVGKELKIP